MGFSQEWNKTYLENQHLSIWPWSDLVSYVMRYCRNRGSHFKVLEIGCGAGANITFFKDLGVQYYTVDGSEEIVRRMKEKFPDIADHMVSCDFTENIPFPFEFDLVVDRASLTHNATKDIKRSLDLIYTKIKIGGKFIGIDWFSTAHSDFNKAAAFVDDFTRNGYVEGQFANLGSVHFSDRSHLIQLFHRFAVTVMEHKTIHQEIPDTNHTFASWNFVAEKK